ncbi:MAG: nuclear transport factor 2 family protein [Chloroflexi bacterium]|nr:nuclear transport factor 2 family protein [Chloroflexota bacterium]
MAPLKGKGFFIWKVSRCEGGNPERIADVAAQAKLTHVIIKVADGTGVYNYDWGTRRDLVAPVRDALRRRGIRVWGWQYIYGRDPKAEANIAIRRVRDLNLDGFVIDAETEYKDKHAAAVEYMTTLRQGLPNVPLALSSYRFPSYHPRFPWREFLERVDLNMPQVYWVQAHNPGAQLRRSLAEFKSLSPWRPYLPTGSAYPAFGWQPTAEEIYEFLHTAQTLGLPGANFWEWYPARTQLPPSIWRTIADYDWGSPSPPPPPEPQNIVERYIAALNKHDVDAVVELYAPNAVHITPRGARRGLSAIRAWYTTFLNEVAADAVFVLKSHQQVENRHQFSWQAAAPGPRILSGSDTMVLDEQDRIYYHFTYYTVLGA